MRTRFLFVLLSFTGSLLTHTAVSQANIGPSFGMVSTNIIGDGAYNPLQRYYGGAMTTWNMLRYRMAVQLDLLMIGTGAERENMEGVTNYRLKTTHLALPIQVKFRVRQRWHTGFGYQFSTVLHANEEFLNYGSPRDLDAIEDQARGDAGPFVDLGYQALFGLGFHVRYYYGTKRINLTGNEDLFNRYVQAGVFWAFGEKPDPNNFRNRGMN
ncbi:MAG: hypothetical protein ACK500_02775 [Flavobacteriales bacterium]